MLFQFRSRDALWTIPLLGFGCLLGRVKLKPLRVTSTVMALTLTGLPVLNVYSATALFAPQHDTVDHCGCWEELHVPTFWALSIMYLAEALPPVLKAEYGEGEHI